MPVTIDNNHRIVGAASVNLGNGASMTPTMIVIHNSAGSSLSGAISALAGAGNSYSVLVDKDGSFHQARAFNRSAGHAGRSNWKATSGLTNSSSLNSTSIGISMINLGGFAVFSQGKWFYGGRPNAPQNPSVTDAQANKHSLVYTPDRPIHWTPYDPRQLTKCKELVAALVAKYPTITEIVGHHDIAIDGKIDPGPLWPLEAWRVEFGKQGGLGLEAKVQSPDGSANLRDRPGVNGRIITSLPNGAKVHVRSVAYTGASSGLVSVGSGRALSGWASVDINGSNTHAGFIYMKYLTKTPLSASYAAAL